MDKPSPQPMETSKYVYLDRFLIEQRMINRGLSRTQVIQNMQVAPNTIKGVFRESGILPDTASRLARELGCKVTDLLSPKDDRYVAPAIDRGPMAGATDWEMEDYLEHGRLASNGLYFIVCRMKHRYTPSRAGRGKFYHLSLMNPAMRSAIQDKLNRHAEVCARVGLHLQIAQNLVSTPVVGEAGWWVIDDWVGQHTLANRVASGPMNEADLSRLLMEVATGLQALHSAGIIFRELAPQRVLIADKDGRAVLTDFELARLLDGSPSVSSQWPEDPYRAPEVDGGIATVRSDLYSLAKLVVTAMTGKLAEPHMTLSQLDSSGMPNRLVKLLNACLEPVPAKRPDGILPLLKELTAWHRKTVR